MTGRGPVGHGPGPPDWLADCSLPIMDAPLVFARIHRSVHSPIFFSPGLGQPPLGRFDSLTGLFGVLYMAFSPEGALAETLLRNPARRTVGLSEVAARSLSLLGPSRPINLVRMNGPGLQALGLDNAITTGPYEPCGRWADALFVHRDRPDGIAYPSRHDPDQLCVALFSRADVTMIAIGDPVPLTERLAEMAAILRRYGKGLDA